MYVAGHISAAIYRSRFGLLQACAAVPGEQVGVPVGPLQPHGASPACCTSEIRVPLPNINEYIETRG